MGSQDSFFEALGGETPTGFFTHSTSLSIGVDVQGNQIGVRGACQGPVGDGVQGFGTGNFSGVAGFGGAAEGTGVVGFGGGVRGQGLRGIGAGGPNTGASEAAGVFGVGGPGSTGVVGRAGIGNPADGVRGFGNGNFSGVAGFGGDENGTGVVGFGGGDQGGLGQGIRGIGAGGPNIGADEPAGVFGQGGSGNGTGIVGFGGGDIGAGVRGIGAGGPNIRANVSAGVYGHAGKTPGTGVIGEGGDLGTGVYGSTSFSEGVTSGVGVFGEVLAGNGIAVFGSTSSSDAFAGYFDGQVQVQGDVNVNGNVIVTGLKSAVVPFPDGSHRRLYCMESPESWFEDFGTGYLKNGHAEILLDAGFASIVNSDDYHVFLSEYDDNNALFVTNRTSTEFGVRSKLSPTATATFSYRVVAKRKDIAGPRLEQVTLPTKRRSLSQSGVLSEY